MYIYIFISEDTKFKTAAEALYWIFIEAIHIYVLWLIWSQNHIRCYTIHKIYVRIETLSLYQLAKVMQENVLLCAANDVLY